MRPKRWLHLVAINAHPVIVNLQSIVLPYVVPTQVEGLKEENKQLRMNMGTLGNASNTVHTGSGVGHAQQHQKGLAGPHWLHPFLL